MCCYLYVHFQGQRVNVCCFLVYPKAQRFKHKTQFSRSFVPCYMMSLSSEPCVYLVCEFCVVLEWKYNLVRCSYFIRQMSFITFGCHSAARLDGLLGKGKDKAVPLEAWRGPEDSRKLSFPDCVTTGQEGGKLVSLTHRPHLPPGNPPGTHFC